MYRYLHRIAGRQRPEHRKGRRWPRSRALGCLFWILMLIVLLIVLSVLFGGFQKGAKVGGLGIAAPAGSSCATKSAYGIVRE